MSEAGRVGLAGDLPGIVDAAPMAVCPAERAEVGHRARPRVPP